MATAHHVKHTGLMGNMMSYLRHNRAGRYLAIVLLVPVIGLVISLCWYAGTRTMSPLFAVSVRNIGTGKELLFSGRMRILTYNICHGRGNDYNMWADANPRLAEARLNQISELLRLESPDIVVLNEVDFDSLFTGRRNQVDQYFQKLGYPYSVEQRNVDVNAPFLYTERFGNVVLSRFPILKAELVRFPAYRTWEAMLAGSANSVICDIMLPGKGPIRLLATHLESRSEAIRVKSAHIIHALHKSSRTPLVVAGDFNSTPIGFPASQEANGMNALSMLLRDGTFKTLPLRDPKPDDYTGVYAKQKAVIDWILVPPQWDIVARRVGPGTLSDHRPVIMDVHLQ